MIDRWHPAPQSMIDAALVERFSKAKPAPEIVGFLAVFARLDTASPWTARRLAEWAGWSRWQAAKTIDAAKEWKAAWADSGHSKQKASGHQYPTTANTYSTDPATFRTDSGKKQPSRAGIYNTKHNNTETTIRDHDSDLRVEEGNRGAEAVPQTAAGVVPPEPNGTQPKAKRPPRQIGNKRTRALWQQLNERRSAARKVNGPLKLTPGIDKALKLALTYAQPVDVLHAYDYFLTAPGARWWQDRGLDLSHFTRQKTLEKMINEAQEWNPTAPQEDSKPDIFELGPEAFDADGNIIDHNSQPRSSTYGN